MFVQLAMMLSTSSGGVLPSEDKACDLPLSPADLPLSPVSGRLHGCKPCGARGMLCGLSV